MHDLEICDIFMSHLRAKRFTQAFFITAWHNQKHKEEINYLEPNDNVCLFTDDKDVQDAVKQFTPQQIEEICTLIVNYALEKHPDLFQPFFLN